MANAAITTTVRISLRDIYLKNWKDMPEKPKGKDLTYNGLVANTVFGLKVDKAIKLLKYYHDEVAREGISNGFSYSQKASRLRDFVYKIFDAEGSDGHSVRDYAISGRIEDLVIQYEGSIGIESVPKHALKFDAAWVTIRGKDEPIVVDLFKIDPVVAGYLSNLDEIAKIAEPLYNDQQNKKHACDKHEGTGVVAIFNQQRALGAIKNPPSWHWYKFSRKYNARPYCDTLGPKRRDSAIIDKAPDKFKKRSSWADLGWYSEQIGDSGQKMWKDLNKFWDSFEYVGDDYFAEEIGPECLQMHQQQCET